MKVIIPNRFWFSFVLLLLFQSNAVFAQGTEDSKRVTTEQWQEDLRFMVRELEIKHADLYRDVSKDEFENETGKLSAKIPGLNREQLIFEFAKLAALIKDGHTGIFPFRNNRFGKFQLEIYPGQKGWFIIGASSERPQLIGSTIRKIGEIDMEDAFKKIAQAVPRDNVFGLRQLSNYYLTTPEFLVGAGLTKDPAKLVLTIKDRNGKTRQVELNRIDSKKRVPWISSHQPNKLPLWIKNKNKKYWMTYLTDRKTVYLQFNSADVGSGKPEKEFIAFTRELTKTIDENGAEKLIVDLRWNSGGNYNRTRHLLNAVIRSKQINARGRLFVITSPYTFSAASMHVMAFERYTDSLFVGEPMSGRPDQIGELRRFRLPNSKLEVRYSAAYRGSYKPADHRPTVFPELRASLTAEQYAKGEDPALETIFSYKTRTPIGQVIKKLITEKGIDEAVRKYRLLAKSDYNSFDFGESQLNDLGYELLSEKKVKAAVAVFELNAKRYPYSANVYDSLGDGYFFIGKNELAKKNYLKAFRLDKRNSQSLDKIRRIDSLSKAGNR